MDKAEKERRVAAVPAWWHSIDLGDGVVTPGRKALADMRFQLEALRLPDLTGKTVLDIGAWDGFFSFEAERRGARRVVAMDDHVWEMDIPKVWDYRARLAAAGQRQQPSDRIPGHTFKGTLPGKIGFDTAHACIGSRVEQVVGDFLTVDPDRLGNFDILLFLGVLYHMEDPLKTMRRVSLLTREMAVIETSAVHVPGRDGEALFEFFEADEFAGDISNWWAPSIPGLIKLCRAAGFRDVEVVSPLPAFSAEGLTRFKVTVHARH